MAKTENLARLRWPPTRITILPMVEADSHDAPLRLTALRSNGLVGRRRPPGDKSISHRALLLGLLCVGETTIEGLLEGEDVLRTAEACRALGALVTRHATGRWSVKGAGLGSLLAPAEPARFRKCGHRIALDDGGCRRSSDHRSLRRRRVLAQAPNASRVGSAHPTGRAPARGAAGRPSADLAAGDGFSVPH